MADVIVTWREVEEFRLRREIEELVLKSQKLFTEIPWIDMPEDPPAFIPRFQ